MYDTVHRLFFILYVSLSVSYLRIKMQMATRVQAKSVPIDIMSTRAFRSNTSAIIAKITNSSLLEFQRQTFKTTKFTCIIINKRIFFVVLSIQLAVAIGIALHDNLNVSLVQQLRCLRYSYSMSLKLVTIIMLYYWDVFSNRITCYYSRSKCGDDRALSGTHDTQWFEQQPISGHSKQHTGHRKHGSQQTVEQ